MAGNIQRRPDGVWRARFRDESGKEHARHFPRKRDAERWLDEQTAATVGGFFVDPRAGRVTLGDFYADWAARQVWVDGTRRAMDLAMRSTPFADIPISRIRRSHVEHWVADMQRPSATREKALAPSTIKTRFNNVRAVMRAAVADRVIAEDPSQGVRLPRTRTSASMTVPDLQVVGQLLEAANPSFEAFISLCAFAGLRLGEAAAIQVSDVDFTGRVLNVTRQVQRAGAQGVTIRSPKYGSERRVPVSDGLLLVLSRHIERHGGRPSDWLFTGSRPDQPPHQNTIGHAWRATLARAGVTGLRLHDLRHFYASGLIRHGCDVVTVQRALGHSSPSTTLNTYSHLWPDAADRTRAAAAAIQLAATQVQGGPTRTVRTA